MRSDFLSMPSPAVTPWGENQHARELAPGLVFVSTASHGGVWLSPERIAALPSPDVLAAEKWPTPPGFAPLEWWEEDCDAATPLYLFRVFAESDPAQHRQVGGAVASWAKPGTLSVLGLSKGGE